MFPNAERQYLLLEIPAVYLHIQQCHIQLFEVGERELFVQQLKANWLVSYFSPQAPDGNVDDLLVVEGKLGKLLNVKPSHILSIRLGRKLKIVRTDKGKIRYVFRGMRKKVVRKKVVRKKVEGPQSGDCGESLAQVAREAERMPRLAPVIASDP